MKYPKETKKAMYGLEDSATYIPVGIFVNNFRPKKIGTGTKIYAPDAKQTKVNNPQIKSLSNQRNIKRKRTTLPDSCHRILRRILRCSGLRKCPLCASIKIFDISTLYHERHYNV